MQDAFLLALAAQITFLIYLLLAGVGVGRALRVGLFAVGISVAFTVAVAITILLIPLLFGASRWVKETAPWLLEMALYLSVLALPIAVFIRHRDIVIPRTSILEVVLINVLALQLAQYFRGLGFLLNPLSVAFPVDGTWVGTVVGLWPTWIAMLLAWRGPLGGLRMRTALSVWTQLVSLVWLMPTALSALTAFDSTNVLSYLKSVLACLGAVHALMSAMHIVDLFIGEAGSRRATRPGGLVALTGENLFVARWHPLVLAGAAAVWAVVLKKWFDANELGSSIAIASAYTVAVVLPRVLMPDRRGTADAEPNPAPGRVIHPVTPRSYGWRLVLAAIGFALLALIRGAQSDEVFIFRTWNDVALLYPILWVIALVPVLPLVFAGVWAVAERMGRPPGKWLRVSAAPLAVLALIAWQLMILPRPHPQGGLDGRQAAFAEGRVYLWHGIELGPLMRGGRAVYYETPQGGTRRQLCTDAWAGNPLVSFTVYSEKEVICRWKIHAARVTAEGKFNVQGWPQSKQASIQIAAADSACQPADNPVPTISCSGVERTLAQVRHPEELAVPTRWQGQGSRYFRLPRDRHDVICIEVPATARLADGTSESAVAVVLTDTRDPEESFWITDRHGSCSRVYASDRILRYEWHQTTGAYMSDSALGVN